MGRQSGDLQRAPATHQDSAGILILCPSALVNAEVISFSGSIERAMLPPGADEASRGPRLFSAPIRRPRDCRNSGGRCGESNRRYPRIVHRLMTPPQSGAHDRCFRGAAGIPQMGGRQHESCELAWKGRRDAAYSTSVIMGND